MFKMKSVLCIVAIFSLSLVSCVERIPEKEMPNVDNGVITMIKATVEPLHLKGATGVGNYSWNETHTIGIYGTTIGENECYLPVKSTIGDNEAYFFGNSVGGNMTVYMPYVSAGSPAALDGRVIVPVQQNYYASPFDHLMYNSTFLAEGKSENVTFDYHAGLVKVELHYDIQNITEVAVTVGNITADGSYDDYCVGDVAIDNYAEEFIVNGKNHVAVKGFPEGTNSTLDNPLVVWVAMAPGTYENFVVSIAYGEKGEISTPVKGPFIVEKCAITENAVAAKKVELDNGIGGFEGENGEFNPEN
jgi:hypothetical protein